MLTPDGKLMLLLVVFIATFVFPAIMCFMLFKMKKITSLHLEKREERNLPFSFTIIFYYACFYMLKNSGIPAIYWFIMLASASMIIMAFFINLKFKISIHTLSMGALTAIFAAISYRFGIDLMILIILSILISGFVAYSRLSLNAHKSSEVYTGYLLGFALMFGLLMMI